MFFDTTGCIFIITYFLNYETIVILKTEQWIREFWSFMDPVPDQSFNKVRVSQMIRLFFPQFLSLSISIFFSNPGILVRFKKSNYISTFLSVDMFLSKIMIFLYF